MSVFYGYKIYFAHEFFSKSDFEGYYPYKLCEINYFVCILATVMQLVS